MSDRRQIGEAMLVVVAIVALLLSAAFVPLVDVFGDSGDLGDFEFGAGGPGDVGDVGDAPGDVGDGPGEGGEVDGQENADGDGLLGDLTTGSPIGGSLAEPPQETAINGGLDSNEPLKPVPLFVVNSPENTYWRQTAYTSYTGTGWEQSTDSQPIEQGVPTDGRTTESRTIEYEVTVFEDTQSLPTAWQPNSVSLQESTAPEIFASTVGGIRTEQPISAGSTYEAESSLPPRDPAVLRQADGTAPSELSAEYTQLPSQTPDRVEQFSGELIAGEETRYDRVTAVERWLKSNKGYSLETSLDPSEPIADQLIFEVDEAYCQQFATTMAVMLRSQDIPARYVVGFAEGQPVGDDEYLVTSDRAHAWVEVYFDDVGWVRFDPTPGADGQPSDGELDVDSPEPPYDISLNRSAVVGASVSVSVEKNETAVVGVPVSINNDRVGWTDSDGIVETTLPYATDVTISARPRGSETKYTEDVDSNSVNAVNAATAANTANTVNTQFDSVLSAVASSLPLSLYRVGSPVVDAVLQTESVDESSETYPTETNATISVSGDKIAGETARVAVAVQDIPVRDATITLDGETVGTTNHDGYDDLSLTDVEPGTYQVTASREPVSATTTFTVRSPADDSEPPEDERDPLAPNISVSPATIALPGGSATATVSRDGQPISGTSVRVDGTDIGETDANGTVAFSFPVTNAVVVATSVNGVTGEQPVGGLYRNAAVLVAVLVGAVVGVAGLARKYGVTLQGLKRKLAAAGRLVARIPNRLTTLLVRMATGFEAGVLRLWRRLQSLPALLSAPLSELLALLNPVRLLAAVAAWFQSHLSRIRRPDSTAEAHSDATATADSVERRRIHKIWGAFVEVVRPPNLSTRTPGETGRYAINRGLPRQPVEYVTDLYRSIEYGRQSPDESRLETARDALSTIRDTGDKNPKTEQKGEHK